MSRPNYWVVIPAAGSGTRMRESVPKQYLSILGKTIIEHTLEVFLQSTKVRQITVCLSAGDRYFSTLDVANRGATTNTNADAKETGSAENKITTTLGGSSRAQSVLNGLVSLDKKADDNDWVLVHDAARPCFTKELLNTLIKALDQDQVGGILATPAKDTLKQSNTFFGAKGESLIQKTLDRRQIWQAQTPQMFRYKLLKDALSNALTLQADITDEASAIELLGLQAKLIESDARNIKVTTPEDLLLAEFLLTETST